MADPLTITTAAIAFFGSANALASTIKELHRVRHAAPAIQSLEDEMLTLRGASAKRTEVQLDQLAWEGRMMQDDNIRALNSIQRSISEQRPAIAVRLQYQLPSWSMIQGMVTIISQTSGAKGPEKVLRVSRIRPGLDEVFIQVQNGNIQRLKQLFNQGQGSPLDASDTGWTLLHYATVAKQMHVAKFLVDAGADPYAESARRESAFDVAWNRILSGSLDPDLEFILRQVFNDSAQLDRRQFTVLHKVVLGLVPRKLRRELEISTAQINEVDSTGYTPLAWACARGDTKAVELLLAYGASLEILNDTHELPIHLAAQTGTVDTIAILVGASADVNTRVWQTEMTPLHFVAEYQDSAEMVEGLVNMGAEVHALDYMGWTPLHWAS
ncbi:hypothetical protein B9Z65_6494 [Elsinoe australis]|uniref:Uncharacterized protein n=1 Tax=Elsinoe australis TaxID=40998 RepID=A0A2P8A8S6_9PEZI|nr:hypothetical protein B9Z65_6494 [Elsinoe australis]